MRFRNKTLVPLLMVMAVLMIGPIPVMAGESLDAKTGIDDPSGDRLAPGMNVIRKVDALGTVIVRLNRGDRAAHFDIHVRGIDVVAIDDNFEKGRDLEGGHENGIWGGCRDELLTSTTVGPHVRGLIAKGKFYTCSQHDTIRLHLGEPDVNGEEPGIKIVFTEGVLINAEGVYVGTDPTDMQDTWIPLFGD